jgi:hypothetical protein
LDRGVAGAEVESDSIVFCAVPAWERSGSVIGSDSEGAVGDAIAADSGAGAISVLLSGIGKPDEGSTESAGNGGRACTAAVGCLTTAGRLDE